MIEFAGVSRRFGRGRGHVEALGGVSLRVERGTVVAVVGPNGAGKSTLFALALGFLGATAGRVTIAGEDPRAWVRGRGAGYLPERFTLPGGWPVGRALRALTALERGGAAEAAGAVARWGLEEVVAREAGELSRGMVQRVGLAQATAVAHELVVLDEPSEGLDPVWRIRLRDEVKRLRSAGATVLLASHDLAEVERVADRVVLLDRGRVVEILESADRPVLTGEWRLRLGAAFDVTGAFPGAVSGADGREYVVRAAGGTDLSERLAALLAQGAVVESVLPESAGLEARVRRALETDG